MELSRVIIEKIKKNGPVCFRDFMEMCLYYPGLGYYTAPRSRIGVDGDFYTSASLTPAFGAMIGRQLEEMWRILGEEAFTIVEYGAGNGTLCRDILSYLQDNGEMYRRLRYHIIERNPFACAVAQQQLSEKVYWYEQIKDMPAIHGCILSNELIDNFPVHQVVMQQELMEVFVDYRDGNGFVEILRPAGQALRDYLSALEITLQEGCRMEINLQAIDWLRETAASLQKGYVMTIDYGYQSAALHKAHRSQGTLLCYHRHAVTDRLYENIGQQDITAHVNFSALRHWGRAAGLTECGFTDQCHFLLSLGIKDYILNTFSTRKDIAKAAAEAAMLSNTLLMDMGHTFKVLIQSKGVDDRNRLTGLRQL